MTPTRRALTDRAQTIGYRSAWRLVKRLPEGTAYRLFDRVADRMWRANGGSVRRMRANYARIRPELTPRELDELVRAGCRSYLRYWCDAFRLPLRTPDELDRRMRLTGHDAQARAIAARGEPLVCFLGHLGNWDTAGAWSTGHFGHVTTVAERLEPEEVFAEFLEFRTGLGMTILPLTGGVDVFPALRAALADGGFVPLLADRDLTRRGIEVDLRGHPVRVATGPARLAIETGAALFALALHYEPMPDGPGHRVVATFGPRVPVPATGDHDAQVRAMTQACMDHLGGVIAAHTQDWHMMQRVFVADLDPDRHPTPEPPA